MITEVRTPIKVRFAGLVRRVDVGAILVSIRGRLGLFDAPSVSPNAAAELARCSGTSQQFVKDWLVTQAAGNHIVFDPRTGRYANLCNEPRGS